MLISRATAEQVKAKNPKLFEEIKQLGQKDANVDGDVAELEAENNALRSKVEAFEKKEKTEKDNAEIREIGKNLGLSVRAEELIQQGTPVNEALATLARESGKVKEFETTAGKTSGAARTDELNTEEVKTQTQARDFCKTKYGCSNKEAWRHAKIDFPNLFNETFNTLTKRS
jgi:hypothetical protein